MSIWSPKSGGTKVFFKMTGSVWPKERWSWNWEKGRSRHSSHMFPSSWHFLGLGRCGRWSSFGCCVTGLGWVFSQGPLQTGRQRVDQSFSEVLAHEDVEHWIEAAVEECQGSQWINKDSVLLLKKWLSRPNCVQKGNHLKGEPTKEEGSHDSSEDP